MIHKGGDYSFLIKYFPLKLGLILLTNYVPRSIVHKIGTIRRLMVNNISR